MNIGCIKERPMSFEDHVRDFNLKQEKNVNSPSVDFSSLECTVSDGNVYINRAIVDAMKLTLKSYLEVHMSTQSGAVVFGLKATKSKSKNTLDVHILKTKPSRINIVTLMHKYKLRTNIDYKIDLIACGEGYLVFAILTPVVVKETKTAPFGEVQAPTGGGMESVPEWSDF
jgi:hypothetical protein